MALPAKIPLKRNEGDRYEGILKQSDTETQQPCSRTYEFERFHAGTVWDSFRALAYELLWKCHSIMRKLYVLL